MYKLIMLPQPILVSDEEIKIRDWFYYSGEHGGVYLYLYQDIEHIFFTDKKSFCSRVIAGIEGLPSVGLSDLVAERIAKETGWVDADKVKFDYFKNITAGWDAESLERYSYEVQQDAETYTRGFIAAQSLNEKKCSIQDVVAFHQWLRKRYGTVKPFEEGMIVEKCTAEQLVEKFLSKPKEYQVEVDKERVRYPKGDDGWEDVYTPKISKDNTIKVIKIL